MARWTFALLALLLACGESVPVEPVPAQPVQAALAPTRTLAPTRAPITTPTPPVVPTPFPTPTALPTPPPTPTPAPQVVSTDGIVYRKVEIPPPQFDEALRDELVLQRISGSWLPYAGLASLEETILGADVIARVSLASTRTSWAKRPHETRNSWGALLEFRFQVHEYLKGSGPDEIGGIVHIHYGTSEEDARAGMAGTRTILAGTTERPSSSSGRTRGLRILSFQPFLQSRTSTSSRRWHGERWGCPLVCTMGTQWQARLGSCGCPRRTRSRRLPHPAAEPGRHRRPLPRRYSCSMRPLRPTPGALAVSVGKVRRLRPPRRRRPSASAA